MDVTSQLGSLGSTPYSTVQSPPNSAATTKYLFITGVDLSEMAESGRGRLLYRQGDNRLKRLHA